MLDDCSRAVAPLLFGCLVCLLLTSAADADGRVFVLDLRNSSGLQSFRDAERACASRHARLASSAELRHAVVECFFSTCTRGWLYGGAVGTTVCNVVGSSLKAVDVRTENATEDATHLDAFCIKDRGVPCGDPPSFPNARLQGHSGYEMGDELLYTCVPGYVMPSGHRAFSLLCDSCGEWYGLVEICVRDETESHVDYEDKFTDSYGEAERHSTRPEEAHGEVYEKVHGALYPVGKTSQEQQEVSFNVEVVEHRDEHGEQEVVAEGDRNAERAVEDFTGHPSWEQESRQEVRTDAAPATDAPVSLLSQKHLFWFPSEAFQDEGHPVSTQTVQRASGAQSEESKEHESQESHLPQRPVDVEPDSYDEDDQDTDDQDDHDDSDHGDPSLPGAPDDSHHDDHDDHDDHRDHDDHDDHNDSHHDDHNDHDDLEDLHSQEEEDHKDPTKPYTPSHRDRDDDHDDHYDMGEHEDERDRIRYGGQEYDDREDIYEERESYEDQEDVTDDHGDDDDDDAEDQDGSKEHPDHNDHDDSEKHHDLEEDDLDRYTDHHDDHDDHDVDHDDSYDDHDSHEDGQHVIFSVAKDHENVTQRGEEGGEATTDDTWLDGYPVVLGETDNMESTTGKEGRERGTVDRPNEVDIGRPTPYTRLPEETPEPASEQEGVMEVWPTAAAPSSPDLSDSSLHPEDQDYDTQQPAPTRSGLGDLTKHPFLDHDLAPPVNDGDLLLEGHTVRDLPGEAGERGEMEGEMGETICTGEGCPPPRSSSRGPMVAAVIVVLCALATAVIVGVWCYRRQQQKSSMYEMNGKGGQSQSRQGQQIEMQQKV